MFNFVNFLTKNAITFDLTVIERKKRYLVRMKFCCASNAAFRNVKIARKKLLTYVIQVCRALSSIVGQYFGATVIIMALSTAFTVVILNIHHSSSYKKQVPPWIRTLVLEWIATLVLLKHVVIRHDTVKTKVCDFLNK